MKCPKCSSRNIYVRIKTGEGVCRRCGYIGDKNQFIGTGINVYALLDKKNNPNFDILQKFAKKRLKNP